MRAVLQVQELGKRRAGEWRGREPAPAGSRPPGGHPTLGAASGVCGSGPANAPFLSPRQWVASIDLAENEDASANVVVGATESFPEQAEQVGARRGAGRALPGG